MTLCGYQGVGSPIVFSTIQLPEGSSEIVEALAAALGRRELFVEHDHEPTMPLRAVRSGLGGAGIGVAVD